MKGRKTKIRKSNAKRRKYGFRSRSKTSGGRNIIRRNIRQTGKQGVHFLFDLAPFMLELLLSLL